jgi:mono/diheme cytochrome c family protein
VAAAWLLLAGPARADGPVDFARDVAPVFERHCVRCHQPGTTKGDVSLATADDLLGGSYVVPGKPGESQFLDLVTPDAPGRKPRMPKEGKPLSDEQRALLRRWVAEGARWPKEVVVRAKAKADKSWWSLRPLAGGAPPAPPGLPADWAANPVDRFVFARLREKGLAPSPPADRRTLIRRVTYDLTGLPPTPEEVEAWLCDQSPDAYERLVDRLLVSPAYGEHWGRHWLDVVRFGESTGFERNIIIDNAWPFRDYVIRSFNEDKPFDRLVREHLAGDVIGHGNPAVEVGTAFLVCGPYDNVGNQDAAQAAVIRANTLDDMIRATGEAFLGVTVGCARCHDHKFDPISAADYYRLYATFAGVAHGPRVVASPRQQKARRAKLAPLTAKRDRLAAERGELLKAVQARAEAKADEYEALWKRPPVSRYGTEDTFPPVEAQHVRLTVEGRDDNPALRTGYRIDEFEAWTAEDTPRNVALAANGGTAAGASRAAKDFADAYTAGVTIDGKFGVCWIAAGPELTVTFVRPERINRVVFSSDRPHALGPQHRNTSFVGEYRIEVSADGRTWQQVASSHDRQPPSPAHRRQRFLDLEVTAAERQRLAELDAVIPAADKAIAAVEPLPSWWVGQLRPAPGPFHVFTGGDPQRKGAAVTPASPSLLSEVTHGYELPLAKPEGERRLALAEWLVAPDNPLTPRVLANRLWHYHFGTGIVDTPSDFGSMGGRPTHPELLDWLARQVHAHGWRLKPLHRLIVTSQTYRQSAAYRADAARIDGDSRLLWRFSPRRLSAEEVRDTMLAAAGVLDPRAGGPGFRLYQYLEDNVATYVPLDRPGPETYRRAVYHQNARAARVDVLTDFDCPDNAFAAPRRAATTTPLQALTLLNHAFTADMAAALADRLWRDAGPDEAAQVRRAFALAFGRPPEPAEAEAGVRLVREHGLRAFCRALLNANELVYLS